MGINYNLKPSSGFNGFSTHLFEGSTKKLGFHISDAIDESAFAKESNTPHRHSFYEMLLIKNVKGKHIVDFNEYDNPENTVFLIDMSQVHYWEGITEAEGTLIYFTDDFLFKNTNSVNSIWKVNIIKEIAKNPAIKFSKSEFCDIESLSSLMIKEYTEKKRNYTSVIRAYLNIILVQIRRNCLGTFPPYSGTNHLSRLTIEFQDMINRKNMYNLPVSYFARELGVSVGYLNEQVKLQTGLTPGKIIEESIIIEAKRLLANTNLMIKEISDFLNFEDPAYFCRVFKRNVDSTPSQYRQRCRKDQEQGLKNKYIRGGKIVNL